MDPHAGVMPAPVFRQGAGRLCLDFIRTLRFRGTPQATEELVDEHALAAWAQTFAFLPPDQGAPMTASDVQNARRLREAVYELVLVSRSDDRTATPADPAVASVETAAQAPTPVPSLGSDGSLLWSATTPASSLLSLIARDTLDLVTSPLTSRVRDCAGPYCGALFLDSSRPGTRRWCSMDTCGNHAKKQGQRAKKANIR